MKKSLINTVEYDFWKNWKNKTETEKRAINYVIKARDLVINSIPKKALIAIYIKGSFARREMRKNSDVDMVPIVSENKYEGAIFGINEFGVYPVVVVPLSIWEFQHNKLVTKGNYTPDLRAEPDLFLKKLGEYKIIYGKPLNPKQFPIREDKQILRDEIKKIQGGYICAYKEGVIDFQPLLKEVFWFIELEQKLKGKKVEHSFKGIAQSVEDKGNIINDALKFIKTTLTKKEEELFISKLKIYLDKK